MVALQPFTLPDLFVIDLNQRKADEEAALKDVLPIALWNVSLQEARQPSNEFLSYYRSQVIGVEAYG